MGGTASPSHSGPRPANTGRQCTINRSRPFHASALFPGRGGKASDQSGLEFRRADTVQRFAACARALGVRTALPDEQRRGPPERNEKRRVFAYPRPHLRAGEVARLYDVVGGEEIERVEALASDVLAPVSKPGARTLRHPRQGGPGSGEPIEIRARDLDAAGG